MYVCMHFPSFWLLVTSGFFFFFLGGGGDFSKIYFNHLMNVHVHAPRWNIHYYWWPLIKGQKVNPVKYESSAISVHGLPIRLSRSLETKALKCRGLGKRGEEGPKIHMVNYVNGSSTHVQFFSLENLQLFWIYFKKSGGMSQNKNCSFWSAVFPKRDATLIFPYLQGP